MSGLDFLSKVYTLGVYDCLVDWFPDPVCIMSFDCARRNMGVCVMEVDHVMILPALALQELDDVESQIAVLERRVQYIDRVLNEILNVRTFESWDCGADAVQAWEVAPVLRQKLNELDAKWGRPDIMIYEFQMNVNDKSRMVSTMLAYHYAFCPTVWRAMPALKNQVSLSNALRHRNFLIKHSSAYRANKAHAEATVRFWADTFRVSLQRLDKKKLDDPGDALLQILAGIKFRKF